MENYVVLIQNNFDERIPAVYGPYEYNAAKEVLKNIHDTIIHERDELQEEMYQNSKISFQEYDGDELTGFTIAWSDGTTSDYGIWCMDTWGESDGN